MTTWIAPATWVNGTLTAAFANAEVRDHLNFLKGALDLLTGSTTADAGTGMSILVTRGGTGSFGLETQVTGDSTPRWGVTAAGSVQWGSGAAARDVYLQRLASSPGYLEVTSPTADATLVIRSILPSPLLSEAFKIAWGSSISTQYSHSMGQEGVTGNPFIRLRRQSSNTTTIVANADGRVEFQPSTGTGATHSRVGSALQDTSTDANSFYVWIPGDTQPRLAIGQDGSGRPKLVMGPGGGTAPDVVFFRAAANGLESDNTFLRLTRSTTAGGALLGRVQGDGTEQFILYARGHGVFNDGVATIVKAGTFTDADFRATPSSGTMAVDTTASKLWIKFGSTWKSVTLT
jgi:hypothetical protein